MSIELKVYLSSKESVNNLCFHAVIYKKDDYDVFYDLNDTYETLMEKALVGEFSYIYRERTTFQKKIYKIDSDNYKENINLFSSFLNNFFKLNSKINENFSQELVGIRLVGAGFRGNNENPMLEQEQFNAIHSMHVLKTALFKPSNNIDYIRDDIYLKKSTGSLRLTLEATQRYTESIDFMREIYRDIEDRTINPFKFNNEEKKERYQKIIESLNNLNKQKRLKEFYILIEGKEYPITQRSYLKQQVQGIYNEEIKIEGTYEGYSINAKSFKLRTEKGTYFCHLKNLFNSDEEQFDKVLKKLKSINPFSEDFKITVLGEKEKPKTISIFDIEL